MHGNGPPRAKRAAHEEEEGGRRSAILDTAAQLFGDQGFRIPLSKVADACGIMPGSLYHHFESKQAIAIALVRRYLLDLDRLAGVARNELELPNVKSSFERIEAYGQAIAECAVRHRAALLLTVYDSAVHDFESVAEEVRRSLVGLAAVMLSILQRTMESNYLRKNVPLDQLAERLCQSMLHAGLGLVGPTTQVRELAHVRCKLLLEGIAVNPPKNAELNRSRAFRAASDAISGWPVRSSQDDRLARLHDAARREFGRRGYDGTTIRHVAASAGISMGVVYRLVESKDELLASIMETFRTSVTAGWDAVRAAPASTVEKLDALLWVSANLLVRYREEFKIQLAWLRQSPPSCASLVKEAKSQQARLKSLLLEGERSGELRVLDASSSVRASCLFGLTFTAAAVGVHGTADQALELARGTLLRGACR